MTPRQVLTGAVCALLLSASATLAEEGGAAYSVAYVDEAHNTPPGDGDLHVSEREDLAYLDEVLGRIFPDGRDGLSEEAVCIEILRYTSSALELKGNSGSATKILREGYAICGGMSHVFRILCRRVGIPARYIGAFYLRPLMGSHAISEVHYDGAWHLFDPTFGLLFYSGERYDQAGRSASFHELALDPEKWTPLKVVARPWTGTYDQDVRAFGIVPAETDYLKEVYGTSILELYTKYLNESFPIAYGARDAVSFPVDANLREVDQLRIGEADGGSRDVVLQALNGGVYAGSHYLGGSTPPGYHTWSVKVPGRCQVTLTYHGVGDDPAELTLVALKGVRLMARQREERRTTFRLQVIDAEALVSVYCPSGGFIVDAMEARLHRE